MIDFIGELRRIQSKDANETFNQGTDSLEALRDFLINTSGGLIFYGIVTDVPGANQFTIPTLAGQGAGKFYGTSPFRAFVFRDAGGAAAAPQGEMQVVTAYVDGTGVFTTNAFTAPVAVGDEILLLHPRLAEIADILALVNAAVAGRMQEAATTIDLNQVAGTYTLFTGTTQVVILDKLIIAMPNAAAGGALTSISIQTDDATPQVIIDTIIGAVGNLTAENQLFSVNPVRIGTGKRIRLTIAGGATGAGYVCNVNAEYRAVVAGGLLS